MNDLPQIRVKSEGILTLTDEYTFTHQDASWDFDLRKTPEEGSAYHYVLFANKTAYQPVVEKYPYAQRICVLAESPINECYRDIDYLKQRFPVIFTHLDELLAQGDPFRRLYFGTNWISVHSETDTQRLLDAPTEKSRNVSFIGNINHPKTNAYKFRSDVAEICLDRPDVDCYGKGIRPIDSKVDAIGPYRFSVAMENASQDLYFTEKLIDCLLLNTVPIYYGCEGIQKLFDPRGMIQFQSPAELATILDSLSEETYQQMLPYAIESKALAIRNNWHTHQGLFERVANGLPESLRTLPKPVAWQDPAKRGLMEKLFNKGQRLFQRITK